MRCSTLMTVQSLLVDTSLEQNNVRENRNGNQERKIQRKPKRQPIKENPEKDNINKTTQTTLR